MHKRLNLEDRPQILKLTCGDSEPGFIADLLPGRVASDAAVQALILLSNLQNLEHTIRKGNEPVGPTTK